MHGEPARDADRLARDIGGVVRQQERDQPWIILRHAEAPHRDGALEPFGDARPSAPSRKLRRMAVSVGPGQIVLRITPLPTSSRASVLVNAMMPPLQAE